jgi:TonB-linked SusC/RagA family outer membrane protein
MRVHHLHRYAGLLCLYLTALLLLPAPVVRAQQVQSAKVSISFNGESLDVCLQKISKQTGIGFTYVASGLKKIKAPVLNFQNETLEHVLQKLLQGSGYEYRITGSQVAIVPVEHHPDAATEQSAYMLYKGTVLDSKGKPLDGVSVFNTTTHKGTSTGVSGQFSLYALPGQNIELSFIGHKAERIAIRQNTTELRIVMPEDAAELGNTVIVGYSAKSAAELTGAVQTITGDDVRSGVTSDDVSDMLKGKVVGVYISDQSSGDPLMRGGQLLVRGTSSMAGYGAVNPASGFTPIVGPTADFGPLIVVDGVISPYTLLRDAVNPRDIKTIVFLKDAASTAIYGSRGAAGVIVITTRTGSTSGKTLVQVEQKFGANVAERGNIHYMNAQELNNKLQTYYTEGWAADSTTLINDGHPTLPQLLAYTLPTPSQLTNTYNWTNYNFRTTSTEETNATVSGGTEKSRYYLGLGYYKENGTQVDNYLKRYSLRLNMDNTVSKFMSFNFSVNGIFDNGNEPTFPSLSSYLPWYLPYNPDGSLASQISVATGQGPLSAAQPNPLYDNQFNYNKTSRDNVFSSLKVSLHPFPWMTLSTTNSATYIYSENEQYDDARSYVGSTLGANGYLGTSNATNLSLMTSNLLDIQKHFGLNGIHFLAGQEFQHIHTTTLGVNVNTIPAGFTTINTAQNIGNFEDLPALLLKEYGIVIPAPNPIEYVNGTKVDQVNFSAFSDAEYDYAQKYFVTGSLRTDASTSFGANHRYGTFYSIGGAWLASQEAFIQQFKPISLLKVRLNYGTNGSQIGNQFLAQTLYSFDNLTYNGQSYASLASLGNPNLTWEISKTTDAGIDLGLWKRITLTADFYNKRSDKLLQLVPQTDAVGIAAQYENVGTVNNRGWEFNLNTVNITSKDFSWSTNFNISFNKNKIISLVGDSMLVESNSNYYYLYPGDDLNAIKGVQYAGVNMQTGQPQYWQRETGADGRVIGKTIVGTIAQAEGTADRSAMYTIGTTTPKFNGGFANTFTYKRLSLSVLVEYVYGTKTYNEERQQSQDGGIEGNQEPSNQIEYTKYQHPWTGPGDTKANEPSVYWAQNSDFGSYDLPEGSLNSYQYDNNSFLRIRNIRLDYNIPLHRLGRFLSRAEVYFSMDNVYTLTSHHFLGADPEAPYVGGGNTGIGEAVGMPRRYLGGLELSF